MQEACGKTVAEYLNEFAGRRVYLHEVSGNNGDDLILHGSRHLIGHSPAERAGSPDDADAILINGGFKSDFWPFANDAIRDFSSRFPSKPLVILPSSFYYESFSFPSLFEGRSSPVTIFARERRSREIIEGMEFPCDVRLGLDHDTAFALGSAPWATDLRATLTDETLLVVERGDAESATGHQETNVIRSQGLRKLAVTLLPRGVALAAARTLTKLKGGGGSAHTPFCEAVVGRLTERTPSLKDKPIVSRDISRRSECGFDEFAEETARAAVVVSTRLHVAILAAILGKHTLVVKGRYHKIGGIYDYSMSDMPHVELIDADGAPTTSGLSPLPRTAPTQS